MANNIKKQIGTLVSLGCILLLMITTSGIPSQTTNPFRKMMPTLRLGAFGARAASDSPAQKLHTRVAQRLAIRIADRLGTSPPLPALLRALEEQRDLLNHRTTVTLRFPVTLSEESWQVSLQRYPAWMKAEFSPSTAHFRIDEERVRATLVTEPLKGMVAPHDIVITSIDRSGDVTRALAGSGAARSGVSFDLANAPAMLAAALTDGTAALTLPLVIAPGRIASASGVVLGDFTLLGTGKSDFKGSPSARIFNIRKALNEHVNGVLVQTGEIFSFNETLEGPVSEGRGWKLAKVIFNTTDLVMAPGGGICQASTTVFRAMLHAGFTPVERANHSMYVSYYEKYGVGIDATIFPGQQDLTFVNDTAHPLLLQAYDEGTEATVHIYGTPDGRKTSIDGPFFWNSDLSAFPSSGKPPRKNEISWVQRVSLADGREQESVIVSRYTSLPQSIAKKYNTLRASASESRVAASVSQR